MLQCIFLSLSLRFDNYQIITSTSHSQKENTALKILPYSCQQLSDYLSESIVITEVNQFIFQGDVPVRFNYGCRQYISKSLLVVLSDFHSSNSSGKLTWRTAYCCLFLISLCEALLYCRCKPVRWVLQTNKTKQNKQKKIFPEEIKQFLSLHT